MTNALPWFSLYLSRRTEVSIGTLLDCSRSGLMIQGAKGLRSERMAPSICELVRRARELRAEGATTRNEVSPPGDSAANGVAEKGILTIGGLVRTSKAASPRLKRKFGTPLAGFGESVAE